MKFKTKDIILIGLFSALTAIGAFIRFPVGPVPLSLQLLFVILSGILLGSKAGAISQIIYVLTGLIGLPVFTEGGGFTYIYKPSFGYLLGFILCAYITGSITENLKARNGYLFVFLVSFIGLISAYAVGVPYLYMVLKYINHIPVSAAGIIKSGFLVFLPGDIIKCLAAAYISIKLKKVL